MKTNSAAGMKTKKKAKAKHSSMQKPMHKMAQESPAMESQEVAPSIMAAVKARSKNSPSMQKFKGGIPRRG